MKILSGGPEDITPNFRLVGSREDFKILLEYITTYLAMSSDNEVFYTILCDESDAELDLFRLDSEVSKKPF